MDSKQLKLRPVYYKKIRYTKTMNEILHQPGFLGTNANFAADMTLTASLIVAILFTVGVVLAVKGRYGAHRWVQTAAAILRLVFGDVLAAHQADIVLCHHFLLHFESLEFIYAGFFTKVQKIY